MIRSAAASRRLIVAAAVIGALTGGGVGAVPAQADPVQHRRVWYVSDLTSPRGVFQVSPSENANPINDAGQVAGQISLDGLLHAAVFDTRSGRLRVLQRPSGVFSTAVDINNRGEVAGLTQDGAGHDRVFLWSTRTGKVRLAESLDPTLTAPVALNDHGRVLVNPDNPYAPFAKPPALWNARTGAVTTLSDFSQVRALNNHSWVVGDGGVTGRAAVWTPKAGLRMLPAGPDYALVSAFTVNDRNQVAGIAVAADGTTRSPIVLWRSPTTAPCEVNADHGIVRALNNRSELTGVVLQPTDDSFVTRFAYWRGCGHPTTFLPAPGETVVDSDLAGPYGINDSAKIVGYTFTTTSTGESTSIAHLWRRGPRS